MKKEYYSPEWELVCFEEDIITESYGYDPDGILGKDDAEDWWG